MRTLEIDALGNKINYGIDINPNELWNIDNAYSNITDITMNSIVKKKYTVTNKYFTVIHLKISEIDISTFTCKNKGKADHLSLLYINDERIIIFESSKFDLIIESIKMNLFKNKFRIEELINNIKKFQTNHEH